MMDNPGRRRFLKIAAASAALGPTGLVRSAAAAPSSVVWHGLAMGSLASIEIRHEDRSKALRILEIAKTEITRLESIFSLYRPDSALCSLNQDGILRNPPLELVEILGQARQFGELTEGAFDVTVQPLWRTYADHFAQSNAGAPSQDAIRRAIEVVNYRALEIEPAVVGLARAGMSVTLNGIAQGYMTDRITDQLRNEGLANILVDLGEARGSGTRDGSRPWTAGIEDPRNKPALIAEIPLSQEALSTSGSYGFRFDQEGRYHHIFDPRSGSCPQRYASVSVLATRSATADALATACNLLPAEAIPAVLRAAGASRALLVFPDGSARWVVG